MFLLIAITDGNQIFCAETANYDIYDDEYYENEENNSIKSMISDPFEKFNRKILSFNLTFLDNVVDPFLQGYRFITPKFVRKMINNLGSRITDVSTLIYSISALDYKNSARTVGVFGINMTIGLFGLFDPAAKLGLTRRAVSLGDVLGRYNIGGGLYLVLPFVGPTTLRDGAGSIGNVFIDPLKYNGLELGKTEHSWTPDDMIVPKYFIEYVGTAEGADKLNKTFIKKSFDPYVFIKNSYIENKNYKINILRNGE
jgi:phospholipid-binding lipoprotein MlaA